MQKWTKIWVSVAIALVLVGGGAYAFLTSTTPTNPCAGVATGSTSSGSQAAGVATGQLATPPPSSVAAQKKTSGSILSPGVRTPSGGPRMATGSGVIEVVAAENFWGSLVSQLGGNDTSVLSIVSDPNADPHEYEANTSDAIAITNAQFIIVNGVGYDDWALQLISAETTPNQLVLNVGDLNGVTVGGGVVSGNPHQWYNPPYVNHTIAAMYADLVQIAPSDAAYFQHNYGALNASLASLYGEATSIKTHFAGTVVAATEDIFVYLANFTNLDLVSPRSSWRRSRRGTIRRPRAS